MAVVARAPVPDNLSVLLRRKLSRLRIPAILVAAFACTGVFAGQAAAADTSSPSRPAGLAKTAATQSSVTVSWQASHDNVAVTRYRIWRNGALAGNATGRSYTLNGLKCGTTYIVTVSARDAAGNTSLPAAMFAKTADCDSRRRHARRRRTSWRSCSSTRFSTAARGRTAGRHALPCSRSAASSARMVPSSRPGAARSGTRSRWMSSARPRTCRGPGIPWACSSRNAAGANAMRKLHRVIRVLHYHNPELYEVSKSEKWALAATMWYIAASDYNAHYAAGDRGSTMDRAHTMLKRGDIDFFAENALSRRRPLRGRVLAPQRALNADPRPPARANSTSARCPAARAEG